MKLFSFFIICFFISTNLNSQNIRVTYSVKDPIDKLSDSPFKGELIYSNNKSVFYNFRKEFDKNTLYESNGRIEGAKIDFKEEVYKDFLNLNIYSYANLPFVRKRILKDNVNLFDWKIEDNVNKNILGYNCIKATTKFRGRNYVVFFTKDIPIPDGPWKFNGLPGLILEVNEQDNRIYYLATEITSIDENIKIETSLDLENSKSFNELESISKDRYNTKKNELNAKFGGDIVYSDNGIELSNIE